MSEWVSVKDRLPEVGQRVLVWNGYAVFDLDYIVHPFSKETAFYGPYDVRRRMGVTHWMPLPAPPEVTK